MTPPAARPLPRRSRWARAVLSWFGWQVVFDGLPGPRGVLIAYPHTSNWDFVVGMLTIWAIDVPVRWLGKESLFRGVLGALIGPLLRRWGGRPVERDPAPRLRAHPGGERDLDALRAFYADKVGRHPAQASRIALRAQG
jgi:1-acyl-sn-glycerol-3-phosphate acyltransferase